MKRTLAIILGLILALVMVGCSAVGVVSDYPAAIMVDGEIYLKSGEPMPAEVDESAIIGQITSYTDAYPTKDGEANFNRELGAPYAKVEGGIAVLVDNEWYLCHPEQKTGGAGGGVICFFREPIHEAEDLTGEGASTLSVEEGAILQAAIDNVDEWVDDHSVDRLAYYFDGWFELAGQSRRYYFTYEYNVLYYDHWFAEIAPEEMQFIKDKGAAYLEGLGAEQKPSPRLPYLLTGTESIEIHAYGNGSPEPVAKLIVDGKEDVERLTRSFSTLRLEKMEYVEPSIHGYELWFRDSAGQEVAYLSLPYGPSPWVNFQGDAYQVTYGSIDLDYLTQLTEIATTAGPKPE